MKKKQVYNAFSRPKQLVSTSPDFRDWRYQCQGCKRDITVWRHFQDRPFMGRRFCGTCLAARWQRQKTRQTMH